MRRTKSPAKANVRRMLTALRPSSGFSWAGLRCGARTSVWKRRACRPTPTRILWRVSVATDRSQTWSSLPKPSAARRATRWCAKSPARSGKRAATRAKKRQRAKPWGFARCRFRKQIRKQDRLLTAVAQIAIRLVQPVFSRRIEDVQVQCVFELPGFVRHVGRNAEHFPGTHDDLFSIYRKLQRAIQDVRHLLIVSLMH